VPNASRCAARARDVRLGMGEFWRVRNGTVHNPKPFQDAGAARASTRPPATIYLLIPEGGGSDVDPTGSPCPAVRRSRQNPCGQFTSGRPGDARANPRPGHRSAFGSAGPRTRLGLADGLSA